MKITIAKSVKPTALAALVALSSPLAQAEDDITKQASIKVELKDGIGTLLITGPDGKKKQIRILSDNEDDKHIADFVENLLQVDAPVDWVGDLLSPPDQWEAPGLILAESSSEDSPQEQTDFFIGVACIPLSDTIKSQMQLTHGLDVQTVSKDYPADKGGIKPHDILLTANDKELHELNDLIKAVADSGENKKPLSISLLREGKEMAIEVEPVKRNLKIHHEQRFHRLHPGIVIPAPEDPSNPKLTEPQPHNPFPPIPAPTFEWQPVDPKFLHELQEQMKELRDQLNELRDSVLRKSSEKDVPSVEPDPAAEEAPAVEARPAIKPDPTGEEDPDTTKTSIPSPADGSIL